MTKQKDLKHLVRARMARTHESYTAARRHVIGAHLEHEEVTDSPERAAAKQAARETRGRAFLERLTAYLGEHPGLYGDTPFLKDAFISLAENMVALAVQAGSDVSLGWLRSSLHEPWPDGCQVDSANEGALRMLLTSVSYSMVDQEYRDTETELVDAIQAVQHLRQQPDHMKRTSEMARLMTLIHTREALLKLMQGSYPELKGRAIPERIRTPGEMTLNQILTRVQDRIDKILREKLPVRLVPMSKAEGPGGFPWYIEDAETPHHIVHGFYTKREARDFLDENGLVTI